MKLYAFGSVALTLATFMLGGCGPGLTSRAPAARASADVFQTMNAELANAIGTTSLTSAEAPSSMLPDTRMPVSAGKQDDDTPPPAQTWGTSPQQDPNYSEEYGF